MDFLTGNKVSPSKAKTKEEACADIPVPQKNAQVRAIDLISI
jgi:hypothetical protein